MILAKSIRSFVSVALIIITCINFSIACTTGLAGRDATEDGRCLLWKNRDSSHRNNEVVFLDHGEFKLIGVINADDTTQIWAGINNFGFAIMNAESRDMARPGENTVYDEEGYLMKAALLSCRSVDEFDHFLERTNLTGRGVTSNFGVIDARGQAAFFETGNHEYFRYNAADTTLCPAGFLARANFAEHGYNDEAYGHGRYREARELADELSAAGKLSPVNLISRVIKDISTIEGKTDRASTAGTVNRYRTVSTSVFESSLPGENPLLGTYWIVLGEPSVSVAIPLWVMAGEVPVQLDGAGAAPLNLDFQRLKAYVYPDSAQPEMIDVQRLRRVSKQTFKIQKWVFRKTKRQLKKWRRNQPTPAEVAEFQDRITTGLMQKLAKIKL